MKEQLILIIIAFSIALILHEFGHLVVLWSYKHKPKLKLRVWGILVSDVLENDVTPLQKYNVYMVGIIFGLIPLLLFWSWGYIVDNFWLNAYLLVCIVDFFGIFGIFSIQRKYRKLKLIDIAEQQVKEEREKIERYKNGMFNN